MSESYKITEVGEIPKSWDVVNIASVGNVITGGTPSTKVKEYYTEDTKGVLWASPADLGKGKYIRTTNKKLSSIGFEQTRKLPPKSILVTCIGSTIGKIGMSIYNMSTNQQINSLICNESNEPEFFYYVLQNKADYIKSLAGTQAVPLLNKTDFSNILVVRPPREEQKRIAEILSTVDEKIEVIDAQITQTQELKKGLMQRLLTRGISHTQFKSSLLGEIPECWEMVRLESVTNKIGDGLHSTPKYVDHSEWHFINGNNLVNGRIVVTDKTKCISEQEYLKHYRDLGDKTVLMSINGTIGNVAFYQGEKVVLGKSAAYISCGDQLDKTYLYYMLQSDFIKKYYDNELTGTTINNLSLKSIRNTPVQLPQIKEQKQISEIISSVDDKLEVLQEKKENYEDLKKGLMQQLLTGKIRVNNLIENEMVA